MGIAAKQFVLDLANSAVGAFLGFLLALYLQNRTAQKEGKRQAALVIKSMHEELTDISGTLALYIKEGKPLRQRIPTPAWDAVLSTGVLLELIDTPHYTCIIKKYSIIKTFNEEWRSMAEGELLRAMAGIVEESMNRCQPGGEQQQKKGVR